MCHKFKSHAVEYLFIHSYNVKFESLDLYDYSIEKYIDFNLRSSTTL
jgi:hypothetical protein